MGKDGVVNPVSGSDEERVCARGEREDVDLSSSICRYEVKKDGGKNTVFLQCRSCPGAGTLLNLRCRAGAIRVVSQETVVDRIVLEDYNEEMYPGPGVDLLKKIGAIVAELDSFVRSQGPKSGLLGLRCERCSVNPKNVFTEARKRLFLDPGDFYMYLRDLLLSGSFSQVRENRGCFSCSSLTRDRVVMLLSMAESMREHVVKHLDGGAGISEGTGINMHIKRVGDGGGDDNGKKRGPIRVKNHPLLGDVIRKIRGVDVSGFYEDIDTFLESTRQIRPCFSTTWIEKKTPDGTLLGGKREGGVWTRMYRLPGSTEGFLHMIPDEYSMKKSDVVLVYETIEEILSRDLSEINMGEPDVARAFVERLAERIILRKLQRRRKRTRRGAIMEDAEKARKLALILGRYTTGVGVLEFLLQHPYVQDIYVNAPCEENPVHVVVGSAGVDIPSKMVTNITLSERDLQSMVSRLRHVSGRGFSEANPVLETDMPEFNARATLIGPPLSPGGVALALRRHSLDPWTLPRLLMAGSLSPMACGLLWFLVDGRATIIIAGSRGAGKSSLLGGMLFAFPKSQRVLTIEDTPELPVREMQKLGYKVQSMLVGNGSDSRDALRVSLRLGESALVLGEVRSEEAKVLYEAMRTGTAGSSVMGTFHADSPRAVYERVVHDIGIPFPSFSATDVVVVAGLVRPGGGHRVRRRVLSVAEVDKDVEGEFRALMEYSDVKDSLVPTDDFYYRSEVVARIARDWGMRVEEAIYNIDVRGKIHGYLVEVAGNSGFTGAVRPESVSRAYSLFWSMVDEGWKTGGEDDAAEFFEEWKKGFEQGGGGVVK